MDKSKSFISKLFKRKNKAKDDATKTDNGHDGAIGQSALSTAPKSRNVTNGGGHGGLLKPNSAANNNHERVKMVASAAHGDEAPTRSAVRQQVANGADGDGAKVHAANGNRVQKSDKASGNKKEKPSRHSKVNVDRSSKKSGSFVRSQYRYTSACTCTSAYIILMWSYA